MSPDGKAIAYTRKAASQHRSVELIDLATGRITKLSAITTQTSSGPEWSLDGRWLAVNTFDGHDWDVTLVGTDSTGYRRLETRSKADGCMDPSWAPSGKWLCCRSGGLWKVGTDGASTQLVGTEQLAKAIVSLPSDCSVSADGETTIFETQLLDEEVHWHTGGRPTLFATRAPGDGAHRVGPDQFSARAPRFIDERRFLFLGFPLSAQNRSRLAKDDIPRTDLYLGTLDGGDAILLREGVRDFSVTKHRRLPSNPALNPTGLRPAG